MLSLTCPVCLVDLTPDVLGWFERGGSASQGQSRFRECPCYLFEVVLNLNVKPGGLFAVFRPVPGWSVQDVDRVELWVRLDAPGAKAVRRGASEAPVRDADRDALWESIWKAAAVNSVMSS